MKTARPVIYLPSARRSLWRRQPPARRGHPCPREEKSEEKSGEKSGEKNRGGDITLIRLRRSLFFVAPATPAGAPSRRQPGETVKALPGRPGRGGCSLPGAPKLPQAAAPEARSSCRTKLRRMRGRCGRTSFGQSAGMARPGCKSGVCMAVRFAVCAKGTHNKKTPPGPLRPPPSHCFPVHGCSAFLGILFPLSKCSSAVSREIPGFCAESRVCGRPHDERREPQLPSPSGLLPLRLTQNEPMLRKGTVLYAIDSRESFVDSLRGR